jgi:prepilin-type processing-associated H-X9-DG protein
VWHPGHLPNSDTESDNHGRRVARKRHKKGSNCLYLDWHVGYVATEDMTADMWRFDYVW